MIRGRPGRSVAQRPGQSEPGGEPPGVPERLLGADALGDTLARFVAAVAPAVLVEGWATVELDRAVADVAASLADRHGPATPSVHDAAPDSLLGAFARRLDWPDGQALVILEPSTEGRLAAALARRGEGRAALYAVGAGAWGRLLAAGFTLSTQADGPLGPARLVVGGPRWGPFLVAVEPA